jgi:hypothetical protein
VAKIAFSTESGSIGQSQAGHGIWGGGGGGSRGGGEGEGGGEGKGGGEGGAKRTPQSAQSCPTSQSWLNAPGPPSSQTPLL